MRDTYRSKRTHLVSDDFAFGVIVEVSIALVSPFDDFAELGGERLVVEQVVNTQA